MKLNLDKTKVRLKLKKKNEVEELDNVQPEEVESFEPEVAEEPEAEAPESQDAPPERPQVVKASSEWTGRDLFVGFPCYKQTNPVTAWCLLAMALDLGKDRIRFDMQIGDAMIYHARNQLAMKFLETDAKWLLFIDDDMILPIGRPGFMRSMCRLPNDYPEEPTALHTVFRLLQHEQPLVGATYFSRHPNGRAVNSLHNNEEYRSRVASFHDGILPCDWLGTGCMLVNREVFLKMQEEFPELAPANEEMPWNFFQPGLDGKGEDVAFCERARACGFQPYVDTKLQAIHVGYGTYGFHTSSINRIQ